MTKEILIEEDIPNNIKFYFDKYPDIKFLLQPNYKSKNIYNKFLKFINDNNNKNHILYDRTKEEFVNYLMGL